MQNTNTNFIRLAVLLMLFAACQPRKLQIVFSSGNRDSSTALGAPQVYYLKKKAINADFPYDKLADLDSAFYHPQLADRITAFSPVDGQYIYYQFLSTFKGETLVFPDENLPPIKDFHDILIIKTDHEDRIIDAYQYTKEWAEVPMNYDLFRLSQAGILFKDGLNIRDLKFQRTEESSAEDKYLKQSGTLKLPTLP